jgi:hypothetical protein
MKCFKEKDQTYTDEHASKDPVCSNYIMIIDMNQNY